MYSLFPSYTLLIFNNFAFSLKKEWRHVAVCTSHRVNLQHGTHQMNPLGYFMRCICYRNRHYFYKASIGHWSRGQFYWYFKHEAFIEKPIRRYDMRAACLIGFEDVALAWYSFCQVNRCTLLDCIGWTVLMRRYAGLGVPDY